jgi:hypothetical protein
LLLKFGGPHHLRDDIWEKEFKLQNENGRFRDLRVLWKFVNLSYNLTHNCSLNIWVQAHLGFGKGTQSLSEIGQGVISMSGDLRGTRPMKSPATVTIAMDVANSSKGGNGKGGAANEANLGKEGRIVSNINHSIPEVSPFRNSEVTVFNLITDCYVLVIPDHCEGAWIE